MFFRIIQHLLPRARAWNITVDKNLRQFFVGLSTSIGDNIQLFYDEMWLDIFPETTRDIDSWEKQLGLPDTLTVEQDRRDRLDATWKALGGQSPRYIEDTLRGAGFDVYVHEWWVPASQPPVNTIGAAAYRNPLIILSDGSVEIQYLSNDYNADMQDGDLIVAQDGVTLQPTGYPLVNKVFVLDPDTIVNGDGSADMQDGDSLAQDGTLATSGRYALKEYIMPVDTDTFSYYLYIGAATFPEHATVDTSRKNEFETLCLKICPAQLWLGMLIDYN